MISSMMTAPTSDTNEGKHSERAMQEGKTNHTRAIALVLAAACVFVVAGYFIRGYIVSQNEVREAERVRQSYLEVNYAFCLAPSFSFYDTGCEYIPLLQSEVNPYGIRDDLYILFKLYENRTGNCLEYDEALDYFSEEYEPDGSLRLYNNGLHPEIEAYVHWVWDMLAEQEAMTGLRWTPRFRSVANLYELDLYMCRLDDIYQEYSKENGDNGFVYHPMYERSPQVLDELCKKEADSSYELDLLSLQQQGY